MSVTLDSFRQAYPAFVAADDATINRWIAISVATVSAPAWGDLTDTGVQLLVAHYVALDMKATKDAAGGGAPGAGSSLGVVSSKGAGGLSVGFDVGLGSTDGAGDLNLTIYGREYARLSRLFGGGGLQI